MKIFTPAQMKLIEQQADAGGMTYSQMIQNAGAGLAEVIDQIGEQNGWKNIFGVVGSGNNGGDTLAALTFLLNKGWKARAYVHNRKKPDALIDAFIEHGGVVIFSSEDEQRDKLRTFVNEANVLADGLLGTGILLPLRKDAGDILKTIRAENHPFVVAVDCPSGMDCESGAVADETIHAKITVTMAGVKSGMMKLPAFEYLGEIILTSIGRLDHLESYRDIKFEMADSDLISTLMPERPPASHKGTFGSAFVVAGSIAYTGAAILAGKAAYRIGAGLVQMAVPEPLHAALAGHLPEATWIPLPHKNGFISEGASKIILQNLSRATAVLIGPGIGFSANPKNPRTTTRSLVRDVVSKINIPVVVDADGLRHLAQFKNWHKALRSPAVLTPHTGEMSALTGLSKEEIQNAREEIALRFAKDWGHVVVLKGALSVIASPDGKMTIIPVATSALAKAGTGDALAGMIVGLLAQGLAPYDAARAGAFIHAQSGLLAANEIGSEASVLAGDVIERIGAILKRIRQSR